MWNVILSLLGTAVTIGFLLLLFAFPAVAGVILVVFLAIKIFAEIFDSLSSKDKKK